MHFLQVEAYHKTGKNAIYSLCRKRSQDARNCQRLSRHPANHGTATGAGQPQNPGCQDPLPGATSRGSRGTLRRCALRALSDLQRRIYCPQRKRVDSARPLCRSHPTDAHPGKPALACACGQTMPTLRRHRHHLLTARARLKSGNSSAKQYSIMILPLPTIFSLTITENESVLASIFDSMFAPLEHLFSMVE